LMMGMNGLSDTDTTWCSGHGGQDNP